MTQSEQEGECRLKKNEVAIIKVLAFTLRWEAVRVLSSRVA